MLQGLAKTKALRELKQLIDTKAGLSGLAKTKALRRQNELRIDLGMGSNSSELQTESQPPTDEELLQQLKGLVQTDGDVEVTSLPKNIAYSTLKKSIMQVFLDEKIAMRDKKVFCPALGEQVTIRKSTANHVLNNGATRDKMVLLLKVEALLKTAKEVREVEPVGVEIRNIPAVYLVKTAITLNDSPEKVGMKVFKDDKGEYVYDLYIEIDKTSEKNKDLGVPAGEESYDSSFPTLPKSSSDNLADDGENVNNMLDKVELGITELVPNIFFADEFNHFITKNDTQEISLNPLQSILTDLQSGTLTPADLDLEVIDRLIADKTPENEAILGQIMDIVADSYAEVA